MRPRRDLFDQLLSSRFSSLSRYRGCGGGLSVLSHFFAAERRVIILRLAVDLFDLLGRRREDGLQGFLESLSVRHGLIALSRSARPRRYRPVRGLR